MCAPLLTDPQRGGIMSRSNILGMFEWDRKWPCDLRCTLTIIEICHPKSQENTVSAFSSLSYTHYKPPGPFRIALNPLSFSSLSLVVHSRFSAPGQCSIVPPTSFLSNLTAASSGGTAGDTRSTPPATSLARSTSPFASCRSIQWECRLPSFSRYP